MSYVDAIAQRFGDGGPSAEGVADNEFIRRVLARKTVRRYSATMPDGKPARPPGRRGAERVGEIRLPAGLDPARRRSGQTIRDRRAVSRPCRGSALSPVFFVFLGDARRLQRIGELRGKPVRNGTLEGFFNASIDAALALQTMILCAESAGLGVLSDQRDPQRDRQGRRDPRVARPGVSGRRALPRLSAGEGYVSLRLPRGATTAPRPSTTTARCREAIDDYDRRRDARHSIPQGAAAFRRRVRRSRLLRLVGGQGAPGRQGRRRGVSALPARTWIHFRLKALDKTRSVSPHAGTSPTTRGSVMTYALPLHLPPRAARRAGGDRRAPMARQSRARRQHGGDQEARLSSWRPRTISGRSSSSRTASRPASTTSWSTSCASTRRSRSSRRSCPGPDCSPA